MDLVTVPGNTANWGPNLHWLGDPTCTQASVVQSVATIYGCGRQLPGTQQVHPSQLTRGEFVHLKYTFNSTDYLQGYKRIQHGDRTLTSTEARCSKWSSSCTHIWIHLTNTGKAIGQCHSLTPILLSCIANRSANITFQLPNNWC